MKSDKLVKSNWVVKILLVIGALWLLMQISFLPMLAFILIAAVLVLVLLFALGAAAIPGLILYGLGRALGVFGQEKKAKPRVGRTIEGKAEAVDAQWREQSAPPPPPEEFTLSISGRLWMLIDTHRGRLSPAVVERLEGILALVEDLEGVLDALERGSEQHHTVVKTVESYIPDMLDRYVQLPVDFARNQKLRNGKTPREILVDQLDILDNELRALRNAAYERKTEELIAHGDFLKEKFARPDPFVNLK